MQPSNSEQNLPPNRPAKANFTGCLIAVAVVLVFGLIAGMVIFGFARSSARDHAMEKASRQHVERDSRVQLMSDKLNSYSTTDFGDELTVEHFIAVTCADNTTSLAKKKFAEAANGQQVQWRLQVQDIQEIENNKSEIVGNFEVPYSIRRRTGGSSGSSIRIKAAFPVERIPELIDLRKGNWVEIIGTLKYNESNHRSATILDAQLVVEEKEPKTAEQSESNSE